MALINLTDLPPLLARDHRLLGIDWGARRIGLALSDVRRMVASPFGTLTRGKLTRTADEITAVVRAQTVGALIVGLPLSMDGSFGPAAQRVRDWTRDLADLVGLPAAMWDERLSSAAANRMLTDEADLRRDRRAAVVDRTSAALILQGALDRLSGIA